MLLLEIFIEVQITNWLITIDFIFINNITIFQIIIPKPNPYHTPMIISCSYTIFHLFPLYSIIIFEIVIDLDIQMSSSDDDMPALEELEHKLETVNRHHNKPKHN